MQSYGKLYEMYCDGESFLWWQIYPKVCEGLLMQPGDCLIVVPVLAFVAVMPRNSRPIVSLHPLPHANTMVPHLMFFFLQNNVLDILHAGF
jgi:hypothetical protein